MDNYEPKQYWEDRLERNFSLRGVGHSSFSNTYNYWLYQRKKKCISNCLTGVNLKSKQVLDIGCGTGFFVNWYLSNGAEVTGIDITEKSIGHLKERYETATFYTQDISREHPLFEEKKYDVINMWDVIYHIVDDSRFSQTIDNISRLINPDGLFLFTDWFGMEQSNRTAKHVCSRGIDIYKHVLTKKGFELQALYPLYNYMNKQHLGRLDNYLAFFYYCLDNLMDKIPSDNLSLSLWKMKT